MPYQYTSTRTVESKSCPGVTFKIKRFSEGLRMELSETLAETQGEMYLADAQLEHARSEAGFIPEMTMAERVDHARVAVAPAELREINELFDKQKCLKKGTIDPVYFKAGLISVDGLIVDDITVSDPQAIRLHGPDPLYQEILDEIYKEVELAGHERENLESPSTSGAETDGKIHGITAPSAKSPEPTSNETAGVSTLNK